MTFQLASTQLSAASAYQTAQTHAQDAAIIATYSDLFTQIANAASTGLTSLSYTNLPLGDQTPLVAFLVKYGYTASVLNNTLTVDWATPKTVSINTTPIVAFNLTNFNGTLLTPLSVAIKPVGGVAPFTFSYTGNIPTGCTVSTTSTSFIISGTPTVASEQYARLSLTVNDSTFPVPQSFAEDITWNITNLNGLTTGTTTVDYPITGTNIKSISGTTGVLLSAKIKPVGGVAPFTITYAGNLPPNCTFSSTTSLATVSGTPLTPSVGYSVLAVNFADSAGHTFSQDIDWAITGTPITNAITALNKTSFTGTTGVLLTVVIKPVGGVAPYTFSITGRLPSNCTYAASQTSLTINGAPDTPTAKYATLTITVTDSNNSTFSQDVDYTIIAGPTTNLAASPGSSYIGALALMLN